MTVLIVILGIAAGIVLLFLMMQKRELKCISEQLDRILSHNSNELVHSVNGSVSSDFINRINKLLKKINETQQYCNRKNHDMEQMMTNISHDLRTPLTSATGYINIVLNSDMPDCERQAAIRTAGQRLTHLEELINSFFELSKIISGNKKPEKQQLDLVSILQEAIVHHYDDFTVQNREIQLNCDKTRLIAASDPNMLMRIFDNLIVNAYKHSSGDLTVTVTGADDIHVRFENDLHDSSMDVSRIFDEFYTTDISRTKGNTGLGLAIAKQFAELLGGEISAEYKNNIFSVDVILIP